MVFPASALCLCCSLLVSSNGTSSPSQKKARKPSCKGGGKALHALGSETPLCQSLLASTRCQLSSLLLNANLHSYSARNDIFPMPVMQHGGSDTGGDGVGSAGQCREPPRWQSLCLPAAATQRRHSFACTSPLAPGFGIKAPCCREQLLGQAFSDCGFAPS